MNARLLTVTVLALIVSAQFHLDKTNTVVGTITKMEFKNPHAWLCLEGKDASGQMAQWSIEFGYVSRDGSRILGATDVKLADGCTLFAGSAPGR